MYDSRYNFEIFTDTKRNVRFTFMSVYSKRMQLFYSIILIQ